MNNKTYTQSFSKGFTQQIEKDLGQEQIIQRALQDWKWPTRDPIRPTNKLKNQTRDKERHLVAEKENIQLNTS